MPADPFVAVDANVVDHTPPSPIGGAARPLLAQSVATKRSMIPSGLAGLSSATDASRKSRGKVASSGGPDRPDRRAPARVLDASGPPRRAAEQSVLPGQRRWGGTLLWPLGRRRSSRRVRRRTAKVNPPQIPDHYSASAVLRSIDTGIRTGHSRVKPRELPHGGFGRIGASAAVTNGTGERMHLCPSLFGGPADPRR